MCAALRVGGVCGAIGIFSSESMNDVVRAPCRWRRQRTDFCRSCVSCDGDPPRCGLHPCRGVRSRHTQLLRKSGIPANLATSCVSPLTPLPLKMCGRCRIPLTRRAARRTRAVFRPSQDGESENRRCLRQITSALIGEAPFLLVTFLWAPSKKSHSPTAKAFTAPQAAARARKPKPYPRNRGIPCSSRSSMTASSWMRWRMSRPGRSTGVSPRLARSALT